MRISIIMGSDDEFSWTTEDWKKKLKQQAEDSKEYRHKLYKKVNLKNKEKILDVGCGTGAVTKDIADLTRGQVTAIDIDKEKLKEAKRYLAGVLNVKLIEADVQKLPFGNETFDLVVFNIVLIHIKNQEKALREMVRVTKTGGFLLATLEPDYEGFLDYPDDPVRPLILKTLSKIGADLKTGRKLKFLFTNAGLETDVGMDTETEFLFIKDDKKRLDMFQKDFWVLEKSLKQNGWTKTQINKYKKGQIEKIKKGLIFRFTPCFYALGKKR